MAVNNDYSATYGMKFAHIIMDLISWSYYIICETFNHLLL